MPLLRFPCYRSAVPARSGLPARPLLLNGFMATGKTTVARHLAERWNVPWVDLDRLIEARAGASVPELFATRGEAEFRRLERAALLEELSRDQGSRVVSLGGGALVDRELRIDVLSRAVVVTLTADVETIIRRASSQEGGRLGRPLLAGDDPERAVLRLLEERKDAYREAHGVVETAERAVTEVADAVERVYLDDGVVVAAADDTYSVYIGPRQIGARLSALIDSPSGVLLVTDDNVGPLHGDKVRAVLRQSQVNSAEAVLTPGEEHKSLAGLERIYQAAFESGMDRKCTFVGLGGGVVTDMTGFAAATWVRGVSWLGIPTTLLSMVDASVGGKTAVDFRSAKNSVGAFWQPRGVICDVETLLTESERAYVGALSEVVKTALIGDPGLFELLEDRAEAILQRDLVLLQQIVDRCVRVKARIVALDERESGIRAHLNLGHTIGHALEASGDYTALTHGEAVSLGLVAALRFGERRGHTEPGLTARVLELLKRLRLPHTLGRAELERGAHLIAHDKKRTGSSVRFIYARGVGDVFAEPTALADLERQAVTLADP